MFTFSFGSAFATPMTADAVTAAQADVKNAAAEYLDGDFAQASTAYLAQFKFKDGLLTAKGGTAVTGDPAYLTEATIKAAVAEAQVKAEVEFDKQIKALMNTFNTNFDADNYDKTQVAADVLAIFNACTNASAVDYDYKCTKNITAETVTITACMTDEAILGTTYATVIATQLKAERDNVATLAATDTSAYSNHVDDWKLVVKKTASQATGVAYTDKIGTSKSGTAPSYGDVLGLTTPPTDDITYTAKGYVEAVIKAQVEKINNATKLKDVATAKAYVALVMNGCKIGDKFLGEEKDWYVEAVPTAAQLEADTSVDARKDLAVAKVKAALNAKQVALLDNNTVGSLGLNQRISALEQKASLTAAERTALAELKADKENLAKYFAAAEEVFTARIKYEKTTAAVDAAAAAATAEVGTTGAAPTGYVLAATDTTKGFDTATRTKLERLHTLSGWVADIKAEAALLETQKDVDGQPYYNAEILKANLEEAVEYLYTDKAGAATYDAALKILGGSEEAVLIDAKIKYIDFINGVPKSDIKDSKGKTIAKPWNDPKDKTGTGTTVSAMKKGTAPGGFVVKASDYKKYDKAQREALQTLISETEAAIKEAKTVAEVKQIFVAAHDKYVAIPTTEDHVKSWGKELDAAYTKAEYDKELEAYANYFYSTKVTSSLKYPAEFQAAAGAGVKAIMDKVVYPVMYKAYTVDELAGKVAEAKAAVDAIKTVEQLAADKTAVVNAIAALPAKKAVTLADKDAITAAADLLAAYNATPGSVAVDETKLNDALAAYETLAAKELDDAFKALDVKTLTSADAEAVKTLRKLYDVYAAFCDDYDVKATARTNDNASTDVNSVKKLEKELSDAKVAEVKAMLIKLPANPRTAQKAEVEAARAAYEALELKEKEQLVDSLPYKNLIDAEEALGLAAIGDVQTLKLTAKSTAKKGSITIKWTAKGVAEVDGYQVWKSTKTNKGFKKAFTTKKTSYKNTKGLKKGKTYYYKVRAYKVVDGKNVYSDWSNKAYRKAK